MFSKPENSTINLIAQQYDTLASKIEEKDQNISELESENKSLNFQIKQISNNLMNNLNEKDQKVSQLENIVTDLRNKIQKQNEMLTASNEEKDQKVSQLTVKSLKMKNLY